MKIYLPIQNTFIGQKFGKDNTNPNVMPFYKELKMEGHNGWDYFANDGDKIYYDCDLDGIVSGLSTDLYAGYGIEITSGNYKHIYWHLRTDGILVRVGQRVRTGDLIGLADTTGHYSLGHIYTEG